jgi:septal ring factor EnvC (AmiA/AmiB activator)
MLLKIVFVFFFLKSEKSKKTLDQEYHDLEEKLNEIQATLNRTLNERKKFEADALSASDEIQELKTELKAYDDKVITKK